jgi:hypothetical protein
MIRCLPRLGVVLALMVWAVGCVAVDGDVPVDGPVAASDEEVTVAPQGTLTRSASPVGLNRVVKTATHSKTEPKKPAVVPNSLRCVATISDGTAEPHSNILRVWLTHTNKNGRQLVVKRGAMFRLHKGTKKASKDVMVTSVMASAAFDDSGLLQVVTQASGDQFEQPEGTYSASLAKRGVFFFGTLSEGVGHLRSREPMTCWDPQEVFASGWGSSKKKPFAATFNWSKGRCTDENGEDTLNEMPIEFIRETGHGVCADLRGVRLNGNDLSYPKLSWWNLQGAHLEGARLFFADLAGATLHGARLGKLDFGYATIEGSLDGHTELPSEGCVTKSSPWGGDTVVCKR